MKKIVEELVRIEGVIGSLLVGKDGLVVASTLEDDEDSDVLGAMAAAMFGNVAKSAEEIGLGIMQNTIIESAQGAIQLFEAGDMILVAIAEKSVNLGMVRVEMRKAARKLRETIATR